MFHRKFQPCVAPTYWPVQRKEAHALLRRLLHSPNDLIEHLRQSVRLHLNCLDAKVQISNSNAASVIMNVTYGITIAPKDDRYIAIAEKALAGMAEAANPGAFLVDLCPFCRFCLVF